ncbi:MAG: hypothetical protein EZS28_040742, partial [Streblomastix strix]
MSFYHFQLNPRYNDWRQLGKQNEELMVLFYTLLIAIDRRMILDQFASIGMALVHSIGLVDYLVTYIMALRAIVNVDPVNYGLASSLNIENSVQVDDELVLGLECVTHIDIQALPLYVVTQPQANDSYMLRTNDCLIAYS